MLRPGLKPESSLAVFDIYWSGRREIRYNRFGNQQWQVSVLSLGLSGLAETISRSEQGKDTEVVELLRSAIDSGVNYFCLEYLPDEKQRLKLLNLLRDTLQDGYGKHVRISTTVPSKLVKSGDDIRNHINGLLKTLQVDRIDYFVFGGLDRLTWPDLQRLSPYELLDNLADESLITGSGFAFHDEFQFLKPILNSYNHWRLCQFQYSFMDLNHHPGIAGLKLASQNGLAVIAKNPFKNGRLVNHIPEPVSNIWSNYPVKRTPAEWSLFWLWNHPEITSVICNIKTREELSANLKSSEISGPGLLSIQDEVLISRVRDAYLKLKPLPCTTCRSCMPCPAGIDIPRIFELYIEAVIYEDLALPRRYYREEGHHIEDCNGCGKCLKTCGRYIAIPEKLQDALKLLSPPA